jgi:hypothetical protein
MNMAARHKNAIENTIESFFNRASLGEIDETH